MFVFVFFFAGTLVDDVIAWPLLALAIALAGSTSKLSIVWIVLLAIGECFCVFVLARVCACVYVFCVFVRACES